MNKKNLLLASLLSLTLLVGGCNKGGNTTTTEPEDTCKPTADIWNLGYTAQDIFDTLKNAADKGNYTIEYSYYASNGNVTKFYEYYTENYAFFTATEVGYVGLPDYQNPEDKLFYIYELDRNGNIDLKQSLTYSDTTTGEIIPIRSTENLDYLKMFNSDLANIDVCDILPYQKGYYTDNEDLILILVNLLGYSGSINLVDKITFQLEEEGLRFTLVPNFAEGYEIIDGKNALIKNIGSTSYEKLENYVSNYQLPSHTLSDAISELFTADVVSLSAKVSRLWTNAPAAELQETKLDVSDDKAYYSKLYGDPYYGKLTNPVNKLFVKGDNGNAFHSYVSVNNEVVSEDSGILFDEMFTPIASYYEANAFRSNDGINYSYYGYKSRQLIKALANYDLGVIETITLKVVDNKVTQIVATTPYYSDLSGNYFCTQAVIKVDEPRTIPEISVYEPSSDTTAIEETLNYFDGNTSFKADFISDGDETHKTTITVSDNILLIEENTYDTSMGAMQDLIKKYYGYHQTSEGLVPFTVSLNEDENGVTTGVATANDEILEGKTLKDAIGMSASPLVFAKDNEGKIVINNYVDKISEGFLDTYYADGIVPSTFEMNVDENNYAKSIYYNYEMDNGYYLGEEEVRFSEWGTASLPSHIDFSNIGLWSEPTSWKDELSADAYEVLVSVFGEEYVSKIQYMFRKELYGSWQVDYDEDVGGEYLHLFSHEVDCAYEINSTYYKEFATEYANNLLAAGFYETSENPWGLSCFHHDETNINIRIVYNEELVDLFIFRNL